MPKKKKFRLYTGGWLHITLPHPKSRVVKENKIFLFFYFVGFGVLTAGKNLGRLLRSCSSIGKSLSRVMHNILAFAKNQIQRTKISLRQRAKILSQAAYLKSLAIFVFIALLGWGSFYSVKLIGRALQVKNQVTAISLTGRGYLQQAQTELQSQNFSAAGQSFALADQSFSQGQQQLNSANAALGHLLSLIPQEQQANSILQAAGALSEGGQAAVDFYQKIKLLHITPEGVSSDQPFANVAASLSQDLDHMQARITVAATDLQNTNSADIPPENRQEFLQLKSQLEGLNQNFSNFKDMAGLIQALLLGQKNVLVMFENNNELRATGGFMGTFGSFSLNDGQINKLNISSIYDLDGQLQEQIEPPEPILAVNKQWYLRDSNWFADFPQSAQKISEFYQVEGGQKPDLMIAMTPQFIIDALKIIGPISMPNYNLTLNPDNFVEQTQVASSIDDNSPTNNPKQVLADFFPIFLQKLSHATPGQLGQIIVAIQNNLTEKQIVLYSTDPQLESKFSSYNWAGQILPTDRDYLAVINSNLGATKTDLFVNQTISLKTTVSANGQITDELTITRTNTMPNLAETGNTSFMRIFVPQGSKLVSNTGFDIKNLSDQASSTMQTDPDVVAWEKTIVTDQVTGTMIGQEAGKTFFGNWLTVLGGQSRTVKLVYTLPFTLGSPDHYSLLLQKQLGSIDQTVNYALDFNNRQIVWKNFTTDSMDANGATAHLTLDKDYLLGEVLENK